MKEEWRTIKGFESRYEISSYGRVRSLPRDYKYGAIENPTILKQDNVRGYLRVTLFKHGERYRFQTHRLVATAFIDNPLNKPCVNHIDEIRTNNKVTNLEWCTHKENSNHGTRPQRISEGNKIPVLQLDKEGRVIRKWDSMTEASICTGACLSEISKCTRNPKFSAGGYKWRYADEKLKMAGR